jgi:hypothetical protein
MALTEKKLQGAAGDAVDRTGVVAPPGSLQELYDPFTAPNAPNIVVDDPYDEEPEPERADVDTLIERPDLGPSASTLVAAGDVIPKGLAHLPRRPRGEGRADTKSHPRG